MRTRSVLAASFAASSAFAGEGIFGTRAASPSPMGAGAAPVGAMPVVQMVVALGIVLALVKFVMPKLLTKFSKKLVPSMNGGIRIEESAAFAGGNLYVVAARGKTLLLSASSTGVSCLADLTSSEKPAETPTFQEMVDLRPQDESVGPDHWLETAAVVEPSNEVAEQLERLRRLAGS